MDKTLRNQFIFFAVLGGGALALLTPGCAQSTGGLSSLATGAATPVASSDVECAGVGDKERQVGLAAYRDDFAAAQPLHEDVAVGKMKLERTTGVVVAVRAQPGLSAPWLRRVMTCRAALAAEGRAQGAGADLFLVPGSTFAVAEEGTGFTVSVRGGTEDATREIERRAAVVFAGGNAAPMATATP